MNLKHVEAFYWLAQLGTHQRVADKLNITQPAVTARIFALESHLNAALVDRSKTHFTLTERGHEMQVYAERLLELRDTMMRRAEEGGAPVQKMRVAAVSLSVMTWVPDMMRQLAIEMPGTQCDLISASDFQLARHVEAADVDIAFLSNAPPKMQISNLFTVNYAIRWVCHADLLDRSKEVYTDRDLAAMPLIQYPRTSPLYPLSDALVGKGYKAGPRHTANAVGTIAKMVTARLGIAAIPAVVATDALASGEVKVIPVRVTPRVLKVRCAYANMARGEIVDGLVRASANAARDWCAANPEWCDYIEGE